MTTQPNTPERSPRRGIGPVGIITAVVGGVVLFGLGASAALMMVTTSGSADTTAQTARLAEPVDTTGVTSLSLNAGVADIDVVFADVAGATLSVRGAGAEKWELRRDDEDLTVYAPRKGSGFCFLGFCPSGRNQYTTATLTLPRELEDRAIDADLTVGVGSVRAAGAFGDLEVSVEVGEADIRGTAETLDIEVGVGSFTGEFSGVTTVAAEASLGEIDLVLTKTPPMDVRLQASTGSISLAVPAADYDVQVTHSLGDVTNTLRNVPGAANRISAQAELGEITLRESR